MKYIIISLFALVALCSSAENHVSVYSKQSLKCEGYFPQLSADGKKVLYSPSDAAALYMYDLDSLRRTTVSEKGMPGFEARFSPDGMVFYIQSIVNAQHLIYRSGWEWNPATGNEKMVLAGQHGAVHAIKGTKGMTVIGETKNWNAQNAGTFAWALGNKLHIWHNGKETICTPVPTMTGYLWADVSPDGSKVVFEAPAKGTYVVDLKGNIIAKHNCTIMPTWYNDSLIVAQGNGHGLGYNIIIFRYDGQGGVQSLDKGSCMMPSVSGHNVIYTTKGGSIKMMTLETPPERQARLEAEKAEAERKAKEEAEKKAQEEAEKKAAEEAAQQQNQQKQ